MVYSLGKLDVRGTRAGENPNVAVSPEDLVVKLGENPQRYRAKPSLLFTDYRVYSSRSER